MRFAQRPSAGYETNRIVISSVDFTFLSAYDSYLLRLPSLEYFFLHDFPIFHFYAFIFFFDFHLVSHNISSRSNNKAAPELVSAVAVETGVGASQESATTPKSALFLETVLHSKTSN